MDRLPIYDVVDDIVSSLRDDPRLVLIAPPGAGKTTVVPGLLVDSDLVHGQIWVLEPRRLAARLAARRVAAERGSPVGQEVGYRVRFENRTHSSSKIVYVTEGILAQRIVQDPLLDGIGAVVLDEFHERSIHSDLAMAMVYEAQQVRSDLLLIVMSATLDPGPVSSYLSDCRIVRSEGRAHSIETHYPERPDHRPIEERMIAHLKLAARNPKTSGNILAFLPGAREINRVERILGEDLSRLATVHKLHGDMDVTAQDQVVSDLPDKKRRRIILSTNLAESSLTIPGVDTVVDSGLAKFASYDSGLGFDHLETRRISKFSAEQRAGRAGRLGPGHVYRVWTEAEHKLLSESEVPEICRLDLTQTILQICAWSGQSPAAFNWFEKPQDSKIRGAIDVLRRLSVLSAEGYRLTELGEALSELPIHPRLGKILLIAKAYGCIDVGAKIAALVSDRDLLSKRNQLKDVVGRSDLLERVERLDAYSRGHRAADLGLDSHRATATLRLAERLGRLVDRLPSRILDERELSPKNPEDAALIAILAGFPDRVCKVSEDGIVQLSSGGKARLSLDSVVKDEQFIVAVQMDGFGAGKAPVVRLASAIDLSWLITPGLGVRSVRSARYNRSKDRVEVRQVEQYGALEISSKSRNGTSEEIAEVLLSAAAADLDKAIPLSDELMSFFYRHALVCKYMPDLNWEPIGPGIREDILSDLVIGKSSIGELQKLSIKPYILMRYPEVASELDRLAPESLVMPSGRKVKLKYRSEGPPVVSVRLQEVFGLRKTPTVLGQRVPVLMELLAPNQRPVQITQDLESFWSNTYHEVRKELRRRYPKHQWPEDPSDGIPSHRVRPRGSKKS